MTSAPAGTRREPSVTSTDDAPIQPTPFVPDAVRTVPRRQRLPPGAWQYITAAVVIAVVGYYIVTARSVMVEITPAADSVELSGGPHLHWRGVHLLWTGRYRLVAQRAGYEVLDVPLAVTEAAVQRLHFNLQKLNGHVQVVSTPPGARLVVDGVDRGVTPLADVVLAPGPHDLHVTALDYAPQAMHINVVGQGKHQSLRIGLQPLWAWVTLTTVPGGAQVRLAERVLGVTSGRLRVPQGDQLLVVKLTGYKARQQHVRIVPGVAQQLPTLVLERADGLIEVRSQPADAAVSVNGQYRGQTPLELALTPGRSYQLTLLKPGYRRTERSATPKPEAEQTLMIPLALEAGNLIINATPADALVFIDGQARGLAQQTLTLDTHPHDVEIRKSGFIGYRERITTRPGFPQEINVTLLSAEVARRASTAKQLVTATGQKLRLIYPGTFTMGSPPRDPGRRANETQHEITLTRPYYLGVVEVSNAEFRKFQPKHTSAKFMTVELNDDALPAVHISWLEAARYCNWLSAQEHLPPFYEVSNDTITGYDPHSTGYRLPTEAEWEYAARHTDTGELRFPWGTVLPPPDRQGNYADRAASSLLGRIIVGYTDGYTGPAPVGRFAANAFGLKDMGGNVAEWVNDFYAPATPSPAKDPMGPDKGQYFVIKGASWMSGSTTELRLAYRDYAEQGRPDIGFRIARFAE